MKTKIKTVSLLVAVLLPFALVVSAVGNPPPLTVAVYDFQGDSDATHFDNKTTTLVTADLATETNLVMLERAELDKALSEQAFGVSGLVSSDAAAKIGQITGAKVLVTGQIIKTGDGQLIIVADIIGTETGRLFADKMVGPSDKLLDLTTDLSRKIAQTISDQATNLLTPPEESHEVRLERIIKNIAGTNRPSVSVDITFFAGDTHWRDDWAGHEFGAVLLKAGFAVVDDNSDHKPDFLITGNSSTQTATQRGDFLSCLSAIEVKVQERRTGSVLTFDRQEGNAAGIGKMIVGRQSEINAVDGIAERILPLLAK